MAGLSVYHIPVCPFSQRVEILLSLKGRRNEVHFHVVDITEPRPSWLLAKTRGTTSLPILETATGQIIKESLVILGYLEDIFPDPPIAQRDPYRRAVEGMLACMEAEFASQGYGS
jgi:glutathione S-transferase